jgi:hypothetical protein
MKKLYFLFILLISSSVSFGQGLGDFIITGYNSDGTDGVSFITVVDIPLGAKIAFTDNGWFATGDFRGGEGTGVWTTTAIVPAGTEVAIDFAAKTASTGETLTGSSPNLSGGGDQVFIYDNDNAPDSNANQSGFIAAIHMDTATWGSDATTSNNSALPSIFTNETDAFSLPEVDNAVYNCTIGTTAQTEAALRASIYDTNNWTTSNSANQTLLACGLVLPVAKQEITNFNTYPNPVTNGEFFINSASNAAKDVQIYNMLGKQVYAKNVIANERVNVTNLNTGIYILKVIEEGKTATRKLVIK